ncbi:NAD(P)/FAD-dependent oxidoreductase [Pelagibacterium sp. 26DY04]|uniref:NAD(P)/FAD-dependent oxidoreductase n=1 Tax=Pelagibacterium sp. 26DY04 TaxID=2967130 RepID=UPI002815A14E|nr:NAD(P)/FAD-dependent oxidoreductase [Pelagibacterium sp. 26DY04]WMT85877.1 NAD(P)/FAD-dependent oxidoreductase [Pelagibacterium sp. 26DY04]
MRTFDVLVIGAGAAGMMCAATAGQRGRSVLVVDHAEAAGKKIRISGGGRCNFTNLHTAPQSFLSGNPKFAISALKRYRPADFIALVERYGIAYHEKTLGQLFCDGSAQQIIDMLLAEMGKGRATLALQTSVEAIEPGADGFRVRLTSGLVFARSLIVATGGKSIPKMGATGFAYKVAEQFGVPVTETRPALVPLTFEPKMLESLRPLAGVSLDANVRSGKTSFREGLLFTHRGLSGPSILQISSYWREGEPITVDLAPAIDIEQWISEARARSGRQSVVTALAEILPRRVAELVASEARLSGNLADLDRKAMARLIAGVSAWQVKPVGTEGYRTAEVTLGGIDTAALQSSDMQVKSVPGLYFIGEAVDVTGWLGGYNFQWAWASGRAAGLAI